MAFLDENGLAYFKTKLDEKYAGYSSNGCFGISYNVSPQNIYRIFITQSLLLLSIERIGIENFFISDRASIYQKDLIGTIPEWLTKTQDVIYLTNLYSCISTNNGSSLSLAGSDNVSLRYNGDYISLGKSTTSVSKGTVVKELYVYSPT